VKPNQHKSECRKGRGGNRLCTLSHGGGCGKKLLFMGARILISPRGRGGEWHRKELAGGQWGNLLLLIYIGMEKKFWVGEDIYTGRGLKMTAATGWTPVLSPHIAKSEKRIKMMIHEEPKHKNQTKSKLWRKINATERIGKKKDRVKGEEGWREENFSQPIIRGKRTRMKISQGGWDI